MKEEALWEGFQREWEEERNVRKHAGKNKGSRESRRIGMGHARKKGFRASGKG